MVRRASDGPGEACHDQRIDGGVGREGFELGDPGAQALKLGTLPLPVLAGSVGGVAALSGRADRGILVFVSAGRRDHADIEALGLESSQRDCAGSHQGPGS
jgi:hypothetical protein